MATLVKRLAFMSRNRLLSRKLFRHREAAIGRPLGFDILESRRVLSVFYDLEVVAKSGVAGVGETLSSVSINDAGHVAFVDEMNDTINFFDGTLHQRKVFGDLVITPTTLSPSSGAFGRPGDSDGSTNAVPTISEGADYLEVTVDDHSVSTPITGFFWWNADYTPSIQGGISSVSLTYSRRFISSTAIGVAQESGPMVWQGGVFYFATSSSDEYLSTSWSSRTLTLRADRFQPYMEVFGGGTPESHGILSFLRRRLPQRLTRLHFRRVLPMTENWPS